MITLQEPQLWQMHGDRAERDVRDRILIERRHRQLVAILIKVRAALERQAEQDVGFLMNVHVIVTVNRHIIPKLWDTNR